MNILEHDSDGKFYHEYSSSITRGGSTEVVNSSTSVLTGFNGLESQQYPKESSERLIENSSSSGIKGSATNCRDSRLLGEMDGGPNRVLNSIVIKEEPEDDASLFSCEKCGKAAYRNGEFETIKLGDIFTHITQFPSSSEATHHEGPRLCAQCLNSSHVVGSTAHLHLHHNKSSVINSSVSSNNNNNTSGSTSNTVVVTSTSIDTSSGSPSNTSSSGTSNNTSGGKNGIHGEGSGQLLQGVSTIIMQNSNHPSHHQQHHHPQQPHIHLQSQYQQQQGQQTSQSHSHNLQSPPPPPPPQEMHHDHQQQHFYQQGHLLQPEMRGVKLEPDSIVHSQQQQHQQHLDNFMLIHDGAMYTNNNDSLQQQQQQTMVSFHHHQSDNHLHHQRQVICDNQPQAQQQQHHQSAIQHITVVTPGSDIKYNIPTAVMQMQGKDQAGIDQGQGQQLIQFSGQNSLIPLPQHSDPTSGGVTSGVNDNSGVGAPPTSFQYIAVTTSMDSSNSSIDLKPSFTTSASVIGTNTPTVVTHTVSSSSSIMTPATVKTTSKASAKSRSKTNSTASGSGASKNAQQGESPKIPCDLCKKKFKSPKMAMNHYKRVHQKEARFICDICGAVFSYRGSLDSHLVSHKPPEKTHDCEKCGMKFNVKANLRQHMRIHSDNPKKFPCDFCPSGFSKRVNLRYHIKRKHPEEAEKMNNNNNSKESSGAGIPPSGLAEALAGTIIPSNPANPGVGDNSKDNKNQGNFKCEHCDRAFLFKNNLKAHLRTHTRDKKYTCDLCGKSFIYKESLKNHMLLHSNELPYLCDICGKKFRDRSNRRKHVKNVHKYLFINGDINNPVKPGTVAPGSSGGVSAGVQGAVSVSQPGEPPTKKRKVSKKAAAAAATAALQQNPAEQLSQDNSSKARSIIKSPGAPRGKKAKNANTAAATKTASNAKSVIVSASTTGSLDTKVDRKIIVSPSPKTSVGSPSSLEYVHSHSSLPVTVHVPLSGSQGQFSHGRNIIVKAASSTTAIPPNHQSPPALSPEMYHHSHQHGRGPASMQQNVIVYPKPKVIPDHSQQYPSSSVISQTMQQPAQHQYYVNADQQHHHQQQQGYSYLQLASQPSPVQSSLMPQSHISSPNPSAFEYVLGSTNLSSSQDSRGSDPSGAAHPYGSGGPGNPSHPPMEIQVVNAEYSHLYPTDPNSLPYEQHHHYHWTSAPPSAPPGMDHVAHPPNSSSPYELVAPPAGSNGSSSGLVNEGPGSHQHPPVSIAQSYDSGGINQGSNALSASSAVYSTGAAQGHEVLDPSGNGGFFYKDDFDFSYL